MNVTGAPMSARLAQALGLSGNPLRRPIDRAEAWIRIGLLAVFLIAGPKAAAAAGGWAGQMRTVHAHAVSAVLLQRAPAHAGLAAADLGGQVLDGQVRVRARWGSAGAPAHTGEVLAPAGSPAGTVVTAWVDGSGRVTSPPSEQRNIAHDAALAVIMTLVGVALALLAVLRLTQRFLNRRRLAAWEAAWSAIGPQWTGRRS